MSFDSDGKISNYVWDFNDGSSLQSFSSSLIEHNYTMGDIYHIALIVVDNLGDNNTSVQTIFVNTPSIASIAIISNINNTIFLSANASYDVDGNIINYFWDMGNGVQMNQFVNSSLQYKYFEAGYYNITLFVMDNCNVTTKSSYSIFVDIPPTANFIIVEILESWIIVTAEAIFSGPFSSQDLDGQIQSITWDFGDGSPNFTNYTYATQSYKYNKSGMYTITLYATDNDNVTSNMCFQKILINKPPMTSLVEPNIHFSSNTVSLDASSSFAAFGGILQYYVWSPGQITNSTCQLWILNSNSSSCWVGLDGYSVYLMSFSPYLRITYPISGTYNISLLVVDEFGINSTNVASVIVSVNINPNIEFWVLDQIPYAGQIIFGLNASDNDGIVHQVIIDFGDNTKISSWFTDNSVIFNSTHTYTRTDNYSVVATVFDNFGGSSNFTYQVFAIKATSPENLQVFWM